MGLVASLQGVGTCSVVASPAPLPDFYMPVFTLFYWSGVAGGLSFSAALRNANQELKSGVWRKQLLPSVHVVYRSQVLKILTRYHRLRKQQTPESDRPARILARTGIGWPWPTDVEISGVSVKQPNRSPEALFELCSTPRSRARFATQFADNCVESRARLPQMAIDSICDFMMNFG